MAPNTHWSVHPAGEIAGWPLLKVVYRTDPDRIADLLPPGIDPGHATQTCTSTSTTCR